TQTSGRDVAGLTNLNHLTSLKVQWLHDPEPLLKQLANCQSLRQLSICCAVGNQALTLLHQLHLNRLETLDLHGITFHWSYLPQTPNVKRMCLEWAG
ncbi:hypothetical protein AB0085_27415, partial [Klebsiella pneumoniae]